MRTHHALRIITAFVCSLLSLFLTNQSPAWGQKGKIAKHLFQYPKSVGKALQRTSTSGGIIISTSVELQIQRTAASTRRKIPKLSPETIKTLATEIPNPNDALMQLWTLQKEHRSAPAFDLLAMQYYTKHFGLVTPHINKLFKKLSHLNNRKAESKLMARMFFLIQNQQPILNEIFDHNISKDNIRMRYTADINKITEQNFNAKKLVLSVENKMSPSVQKDFSVRHINAHSVLQTSKEKYPIYQYMGPLDLIPNLYKYLLNGKNKHAPITVVLDEDARSLAMYNNDKSLWLRVTPHEYENPKKIHIHLNEYRTVTFTDADGILRIETVNVNLSIPILQGIDLPAHPQQARQFLYEKLVIHPVKHLQGDAHVTIESRPIF